MKQLSTLFIASVLFITGCKKTDDTPIETPKNQQITIKTFDKQSFDIEVATDQGYVTLNLEDLPEKVEKVKLSPETGTTSFNTQLTINSKQATAGNYSIKLVSYKDGLTDSFQITPIDLVVEPLKENECNSFFSSIANGNNAGAYILDSSETRAFGSEVKIIETEGSLSFKNLVLSYYIDSKVAVSKLSGTDQIIPFTIACESGVIKIPSTSVTDVDGKSFTVSGSGSIDYKTQNYSIKYTSGTQTMNLRGSVDLDAYYSE